jgi:hypothetical protein
VTKVHVRTEGLSCSRKQTDLLPKFPCFVLLIPHFAFHMIITTIIIIVYDNNNRHIVLPVRFLFKDRDINCMSNSVHNNVPQGANHFCGPSDLLSTTTACFSKLIAYIFWCSCCGQNLIQFATHCRPFQQALSVRRERSQSPKTACPKVAMSIIMIPKTLHT